MSPHPELSRVVAVPGAKDVYVEADDGEDVGVQQELAVAHHFGGELPHAGLPVGKVHGDLWRKRAQDDLKIFWDISGFPFLDHPVTLKIPPLNKRWSVRDRKREGGRPLKCHNGDQL